ncbi:GtrA family protein [Saccharopolyspora sp. NFXS83]|uniref:GtrA family protein n=1 Tax=Saccharopolyspora sp. NFXS83 TaxID=2993560 RepID=UPI00224B2914|nr:GtrA family protein [Saccharopolyspora sp. NFXS83]MCX2733021.1 GtrA family protein [Saccharopolyspora sp. NFXS83]
MRAPIVAGPWRRDLGAACGVAVVVALLAQLPVLVNPAFYFWDDSAAQFLPMWHRLGERVLAGQWPPLLEPDSWMGGDIAAEALFGVWNPVHLVEFVLVVAIGDLAVAAVVVKTQFLVLLGVGTHVLCREYGASRPVAAVFGVALPVSGFVLYFQAATWAGGLMGLAWVPWAWWALRRAGRDRAPVWVAFVFGYLCVSAGDPYAVLALVLVGAGLLLELRFARLGVRRLLLAAVPVAMVVPLVFVPVLATAPVGWRTGLLLFNAGLLAPDAGDLLNLSVAGFVPQIRSFGSFRMTVPALYFTWFALPLAPWLDWRVLRARARHCAGVFVVAGAGVLLCLGPSQVGMLRWPLRHLPVVYLALAVVLAVALSSGVRTEHRRTRTLITLLAVALCGYLSFAAWPSLWARHVVSVVLMGSVLGLVALGRRALVPWGLQLGTVVALVCQVCWFPANHDVAVYSFPSDVRRIRADFAHLRSGTVVQIADRSRIAARDVESGAAWRQLLFGNMHAVAGVPSLVSYTGIGFRSLHERLCLGYFGAQCPDAYRRLWEADETGAPLADQLRVRHVVVQRRSLDFPVAPPGWRVVHRDAAVTRLQRSEPVPWPAGRLSVASDVRVLADDERSARSEQVRFDRAGPRAELVFARLAWPGYRATADGAELPVRATSAGLVRVELPEGTRAGTVRLDWSPPGYRVGIALALAGALLALLGGRRWA